MMNTHRVSGKLSRVRQPRPEVKEGRRGVRAAEKWGEGRKSNSGQEDAGVIRELEVL